MSAWSQAVWIVKQIEKNFDVSQQINSYVNELNDLNTEVNNLNSRVANDQQLLQTTKTNLQKRAVTILAKESETTAGKPDGRQDGSYGEGAIWLILAS